MQILAKNLKYVYSQKSKTLATSALNGVNLTIKEGEFFGIVGKTGSGKSTFVQHLNGLIIPQKDTIFEKNQKIPCAEKENRIELDMLT